MKNFFSRNNPLYLITDTSIAGCTHFQIVKNAISAGVQTVQLREHDMTKKELYSEAVMVRDLTLIEGATSMVNFLIVPELTRAWTLFLTAPSDNPTLFPIST